MTEPPGNYVTVDNQWEVGNNLPTPERLRALEGLLQPPSSLAFLAGVWGPSPVDHERRLQEVERRLDEIRGL